MKPLAFEVVINARCVVYVEGAKDAADARALALSEVSLGDCDDHEATAEPLLTEQAIDASRRHCDAAVMDG